MAPETLPTVLFLHPSDEMYGADRQLLALVRASCEICRPVVLLPNDVEYEGRLSAVLREEGVTVESGGLPVLRRRYGSARAIIPWLLRSTGGWWWVLRTARRTRARAIVSNSAGIQVGPSVAGLLRIPHVWFVREVIESPRWFRSAVRWAARLSRGEVYTVSDAVRGWLGPIPGRGPTTIHDGVVIGDELESLPASPRAVFVGRISDWKGWDAFVAAARLAHQRVPAATFGLIGGVVEGGEIDPDAVRAVVLAADPSHQWLEWLGEVPDASPSMREAWLVAVPSKRPDPFPNVVLEAMVNGRAVVGSDLGGIPEMVIDGETGILVEAGDAAGMADAMVAILADRTLAERYGANGRARVSAEFSMDRFEDDWSRRLGAWLR